MRQRAWKAFMREQERRWAKAEKVHAQYDWTFRVDPRLDQWAATAFSDIVDGVRLDRASHLIWRREFGLPPVMGHVETVWDGIVSRAVDAGMVTLPCPGRLKTASAARDRITEEQTANGFGFYPDFDDTFLLDAQSSIGYDEQDARPETGSAAAAAFIRHVIDTFDETRGRIVGPSSNTWWKAHFPKDKPFARNDSGGAR